jgi:hypothetical protein
MAIKDWPAYGTDKAFWPKSAELKQVHNNRVLESQLSGDIQTQSVPGARWGWILNFDQQTWAERGRLLAFLTALNGMEHRVRLFDPRRPPGGSLVGRTGVTLGASASQFAESITLANAWGRNRLQRSKSFDHAAWTKTRTTCTGGSINAAVAPDGTTTADRIVSDATAATSHYVNQNLSGLADNQVVSFSAHLHQDVADRGMLQMVLKGGGTCDLEFKFDDQKMLRTSAGGGNTAVAHSVQSLGAGWYRLKMEGINVGSGGTTPAARIILARNPTLAETNVWSRTGTSGASSGATPPVAGKRVAALTEDTSSGGHYASASINFVAGKTYQLDAWAQVLGAGATRYLSLVLPSGTAWGVTQGATFDLAAGVVTFTTGTGANLQASITDAGGGWWLCSITATAVGTGAASPQVRLCNVNSGVAPSYAGDGASGLLVCEPYIRCTDSSVGLGACTAGLTFDGDNAQSFYVWGAQLDLGAAVTDYEPGGTLQRGDWLNIAGIGTNGQLVMAAADAAADDSGAVTVEVRHPLRAAASSGAAVTLLDPTALYILTTNEFGSAFESALAPPMSIELREVFA